MTRRPTYSAAALEAATRAVDAHVYSGDEATCPRIAKAVLDAALDAEDQQRADLLTELRAIRDYAESRMSDEGARHQYVVETVTDRLAALIARMEGK